MDRKRPISLALFLATAAITLVWAGTSLCAETSPQAAPIVRAVENRYHNAKTLKAIFLERYSSARDSLQIESGTVYFSRPGRMRWEYEAPEKKLFVADGKTVWFFVPADHTVTRAPMKESVDWRTPLALLTGKTKLSTLCDRIDLAPSATPGHVTLKCLPRGEGKKAASAHPGRSTGTRVWQVPTSRSTRCCWRSIARPANWRTCACYSRAASNWIFDLATGSKIFRSRIRSSTSNRHRAWPSSINPLHSPDLDRRRCAATGVELNRPSLRPKRGCTIGAPE